MKLLHTRITNHAVKRYVERVRPEIALDTDAGFVQAFMELGDHLERGVERCGRPPWHREASLEGGRYVEIEEGRVALMLSEDDYREGWVLRTVLVRPDGWREGDTARRMAA